jgi:hypothetical protein
MSRFSLGFAIAAVLATMVAPLRTSAAPPTVTPSPGYDARLQEEHAARSAMSQPAGVNTGSVARHRLKKTHHPAH